MAVSANEQDWVCQRCGEASPSSLDACWKCGTSRDGTPDPTFQVEVDPFDALARGRPSRAHANLLGMSLVAIHTILLALTIPTSGLIILVGLFFGGVPPLVIVGAAPLALVLSAILVSGNRDRSATAVLVAGALLPAVLALESGFHPPFLLMLAVVNWGPMLLLGIALWRRG